MPALRVGVQAPPSIFVPRPVAYASLPPARWPPANRSAPASTRPPLWGSPETPGAVLRRSAAVPSARSSRLRRSSRRGARAAKPRPERRSAPATPLASAPSAHEPRVSACDAVQRSPARRRARPRALGRRVAAITRPNSVRRNPRASGKRQRLFCRWPDTRRRPKTGAGAGRETARRLATGVRQNPRRIARFPCPPLKLAAKHAPNRPGLGVNPARLNAARSLRAEKIRAATPKSNSPG